MCWRFKLDVIVIHDAEGARRRARPRTHAPALTEHILPRPLESNSWNASPSSASFLAKGLPLLKGVPAQPLDSAALPPIGRRSGAAKTRG